MTSAAELPTGLHESIVTTQLHEQLAAEVTRSVELAKIDDGDQTHVLVRHISAAVNRRLASIKDPAARLTTMDLP